MENNKPKTSLYWLAELINSSKEVTLSDEHTDFKWLPLEEACKLSGFPDMIEALKNCDKYIKNNLM